MLGDLVCLICVFIFLIFYNFEKKIKIVNMICFIDINVMLYYFKIGRFEDLGVFV